MNFEYEEIINDDLAQLFLLSEEQLLTYEDFEEEKNQLIMDYILSFLMKNRHLYKAIFKDDDLIGYVSLEEKDGHIELVDIFLFKEFRGRGLGRLVMEDVILACDNRKRIILNVYQENKAALRLYREFGFEDYEDLGDGKLKMLRKREEL